MTNDAATTATATADAASKIWDPRQYERFKAERSRPFGDLVDLIEPTVAPGVVDLGCGTGELTATLADRLGSDDVLGIDFAPAMLADAAAFANDRVRFASGDIATWVADGRWDVIVSNAALQWVPNHADVLSRWTRSLRPGGQLAVQMPHNAGHPSHLLAAEVANEAPFASAFAASVAGAVPPDPVARNVLAPEAYAELLHALGFVAQHVRLQVYGHVLASTADVVEWTKGTTLNRFKALLPDDLYAAFIDRYRQRLLTELGERAPYFYPFRRVLLWGRLA